MTSCREGHQHFGGPHCSQLSHEVHPEDGGSTALQNIGIYHITTRCHNPEDHKLNLQCHENIKSQILIVCQDLF